MRIAWSSIFVDQPLAERFNRAIEVLLVTLLAFCPLAFGAVHAWSEQIVIALAAAISVVFLVKLLLCRDTRFIWSWAYVPIAVFAGVAVLQLLPLPPAWVRAISPNTVALKTELLGNLPDADRILSSMTLSFYPRATRHDLRLVLAVAAVFVVVVNIYRGSERIKRLLGAVAVIGGGIALLALAQDIMGNGKIYWVVPTYGEAYSGTFINHSHYGQFMNLSMGAALALLLVRLHEAFTGRGSVTPVRVAEYLGAPEARATKLLLAMVVVGAATVFVSLTRGGMVSMLIAAVFVTLVLCSRQSLKGQAWVLVLVAMGAFVCILWVGFEEVYDRVASFRDISTIEGGRWQIVKDTVTAWTKYPIVGTGLGTYEVVYPMFDSSSITALATHAENEYVQMLAETGFVGFLTLAVLGIGVWISFARSVNVASVPICSAAYGLGFGLLAILVHSLSDFGQHMPANAMLTATTCALLVGLTHMDRQERPSARGLLAGAVVRAGRLIVLLLTGAAFGWALLGANSARVAEAHWNKVLATDGHLETLDWQGDARTYEYLLAHAEAAVAAEPDNIKYRHWHGVYQWLNLLAQADPNATELDAKALPEARRIANVLHDARQYCPTFGATPCVAGEIEKFVLNDPIGIEHIAQGYRLAPCDAVACFAAGRADAETGAIDSAMEKLTRAVRLDGSYFRQAASLCVDDLKRPDLAIQLAQDNTRRLSLVANILEATKQHTELVEQTRARVAQLVAEQSKDPDAPAWMHVFMAKEDVSQGRLDAAIERYRLALRKDYGQVRWHYELARLLAQAGRVQEAVSEARICLRFEPNYRPAKKLLEELSVRPSEPEPPAAARR